MGNASDEKGSLSYDNLVGDGQDIAGHSVFDLDDASGLDAVPDLVGNEMRCPAATAFEVIGGLYSLKFDSQPLSPRSYPSDCSFSERVRGGICEGRSLDGQTTRFIPASFLEEFWEPETVRLFLHKDSFLTNDASERIARDYRNILTILTLASKPSAIWGFLANGVDDHCLPVPENILNDTTAASNDQLESLRHIFAALDEQTVEAFLRLQHVVNPPQMQLDCHPAERTPGYQKFPEGTILPFTHVEQASTGGFGTVFRVKIHRDHYRGGQSGASSDRDSPSFAIKKLHSRDEHAFAAELNALQKLAQEDHPGIVPFLGGFQLGQDFHLVFPWAEGDLSTFWRMNPEPEITLSTVKQLWEQIMGLAEALAFIHGQVLTSNEAVKETSDSEFTVHCDLKPANILWFREEIDGHMSDVFKIADFGSTLVGVSPCKTVEPEEMPRTTPVYRAPEWDLKPRKISPAADIWSLGCILIEIAAWMAGGSAALEGLSASRQDVKAGDPSRDAFFYYATDDLGQPEAKLKPGIEDWMSRISKVSELSADLVSLVYQDMLAFNKEDRMFGRLTSQALSEALSQICQKIDSDPTYCEPRGPLEMVHSNPPTKSHRYVHRKRAPATVSAASTENEAKRKKTETDVMNSEFSDTYPMELTGKFACPFFKAGFDKNSLVRACIGPGWKEVHRVKEHIKRCHTPESFKSLHVCSRCLEKFGSEEQLLRHHREEAQCIIRSQEFIHGQITFEQAVNLRSTKKKTSDMTDEEKWFSWFRILFPSYPLPSSPYNEDDTSSTLNTLSTQNSTGISEYKEYLRTPLDDAKQKALEEDLGEEAGISNPAMRKALAAAFRKFQLRDIQKFDEDKLKPTYGIPGPRRSPVAEKDCDGADDTGDGAAGGLDSFLSGLSGGEDFWNTFE